MSPFLDERASALVSALSEAAPTPPSGNGISDFLSSLSSLGPILQLGFGGFLAILLIKRIWIMPVGEFTDYKEVTERQRIDTKEASDQRISKLETDLDTSRATSADLTDTIIKQTVIMTRVAGPLSELVELKRAQPRRRGQNSD